MLNETVQNPRVASHGGASQRMPTMEKALRKPLMADFVIQGDSEEEEEEGDNNDDDDDL